MRPNTSDMYIDAALTQVSIAYRNASFVIDALAPRVTVNVTKDTGNYYLFGKQSLRRHATKWGGKSLSNRAEWTVDKTPAYAVEKNALHGVIYTEDKDNADSGIQYEASVVQNVLDMLSLGEECDLADVLTATATFGSGRYDTPDDLWDDFANSNPAADISDGKETIRKSIGRRPNIGIFGAAVLEKLRRHPKLLSFYTGVAGGVLTDEQLRAIFGLEQIIEGGAIYLSSKEGAATETTADVWGKNVVLLYQPARPALRELAFFYKIAKAPVVERWYSNEDRGDIVQPIRKYQHKVVCQPAGFLLANVIG